MKPTFFAATRLASSFLFLFFLGVCLFRPDDCVGQELQQSAAKERRQQLRRQNAFPGVAAGAAKSRAESPVPAVATGTPAAKAAPSGITFNPTTGPAGTKVQIKGTNFDSTVKVYFNGVAATNVSVSDSSTMTATIGAGATGPVKVQNSFGSFTTANSFTFIPPPIISQVVPATFTQGASITLLGTGFTKSTTVSVDGTAATGIVFGSPTTTIVTVNGPVTSGIITVSDPTNGGSVFSPTTGANGGVGGNADFTLPGLGDQVLIVPTPTFTYLQPHPGKVCSFEAKVWGNSLGTDSSLQRLANKLLLPQTSIIGLQTEFNIAIPWLQVDTVFNLNIVADLNLLLKKISYLDTSAKNNFNPWAFHPRIGLAATFYKDNFYAGYYYNIMNILSNYDQFKAFFKCGSKNVFVYPEFNVGGLFSISGNQKQKLKFELDGIFNNKDVNLLYNQYSGVIISVKVGFVTTL